MLKNALYKYKYKYILCENLQTVFSVMNHNDLTLPCLQRLQNNLCIKKCYTIINGILVLDSCLFTNVTVFTEIKCLNY